MSSIASTTFHVPAYLPSADAPSAGAEHRDPDEVVASSSVFGSAHFDPDAITPEGLLIYLSGRLGSLDGQMDDIFDRQQSSEKVRSELRDIQKLLTAFQQSPDEQKLLLADQQLIDEIGIHIDNIRLVDEQLAEELGVHLRGDGQILVGDQQYTTMELNGSKEYLNMIGKDLEAGAQMDMIALQSLMSARQTAIQLSTNLVSALNESAKSVVANIR
jgi:hypothetical protein